jgi:hypothetical protein
MIEKIIIIFGFTVIYSISSTQYISTHYEKKIDHVKLSVRSRECNPLIIMFLILFCLILFIYSYISFYFLFK